MVQRIDAIMKGYKGSAGPSSHLHSCSEPLLDIFQKWSSSAFSRSLNIPYSEVTGVVSFYSFFSTVRGERIWSGFVLVQPATYAAGKTCSMLSGMCWASM
jgi:hypothetical protein